MPKPTIAVDDAKLAELARDSVDARPTTQMDPAEMRSLLGNAVPLIDELGKQKPVSTDKGMAPLTKPPPMGEVLELGTDDRKSRKQRALEKPAEPANATPRSTIVLIALLALVSVIALVGWLR